MIVRPSDEYVGDAYVFQVDGQWFEALPFVKPDDKGPDDRQSVDGRTMLERVPVSDAQGTKAQGQLCMEHQLDMSVLTHKPLGQRGMTVTGVVHLVFANWEAQPIVDGLTELFYDAGQWRPGSMSLGSQFFAHHRVVRPCDPPPEAGDAS